MLVLALEAVLPVFAVGAEVMLSVESLDSVSPGSTIETGVYLTNGDSSWPDRLSRLCLNIAYDSTTLKPIDVRRRGSLSAWPYFEFSRQPHPPIERFNASLTIRGECDLGADSGSVVDDSCILELVFRVKDDSALFGATTAVVFIWDSCLDNTLSLHSKDTIHLVGQVLTASGAELPVSAGCPQMCGPDSTCLPSLITPQQWATASLVVQSSEIAMTKLPVPGCPGDVDLDTSPFEADDVSILAAYFLEGRPAVFESDVVAQVRATDVNEDGRDTTLADLVQLRYRHLGVAFEAEPQDTTMSSMTIQTDDSRVRYILSSPVDVGAIQLGLDVNGTQVDSVVFGSTIVAGPAGVLGHVRRGDTVQILAFGGRPLAPMVYAGETEFVDLFYSGYAPLLLWCRATDSHSRPGVVDLATSVTEPPSPPLMPGCVSLSQNYPNPFNPSTTIRFELHRRSCWRLEICNVLGQAVWTCSGPSTIGKKQVEWNGVDGQGRPVASGIYWYRLMTESAIVSRKMLLVR